MVVMPVICRPVLLQLGCKIANLCSVSLVILSWVRILYGCITLHASSGSTWQPPLSCELDNVQLHQHRRH
jgi:hypothetical protein